MKILNRYITKSFLSTFLATVVVFTFVLTIGGLFKLTDLVARGVPLMPILRIFLTGLPSALAFAVPISAITATLLIFGRMSADSEITAMKACGISLWQIVLWMLPAAVLLLAVCVYINIDLVPRSHFARRTTTALLGTVNPVDLIQEGCTIREFEGLSLYVGSREGHRLEDVRIFDLREEGRTREIKAERGTVVMPENSNDIVLSLEAVTINPFSFDRPGAAYSGRWSMRIEDARRRGHYRRQDKDRSLVDLYQGAREIVRAARRHAVGRAWQALETALDILQQVAVVRQAMRLPELNRDAYVRAEPWPGQALPADAYGSTAASYGVHGWGQAGGKGPRADPFEALFFAGAPFAGYVERFVRETLWSGMEAERIRMTAMRIELHKRLALSAASFAFIFLGIPLGIRSHRRESSLGIGLSLLVVFVFYMFIIVADELSGQPALRPDLLNWVPVILFMLLGAWMIRHQN